MPSAEEHDFSPFQVDWTNVGGADGVVFSERIKALEKWMRTHRGIDYNSAGPDYPHPSQKVRTLYFYEGNGRLSNAGLQALVMPDGVAYGRIMWLTEFSDTLNTAYPRASISTSMDNINNVVGTYSSAVASGIYSWLQLSSNAVAGDPSVAQLKAANVNAGLGSNNDPTAEIYVTSAAERYFKIFNAPLLLQGVTSDFATLSDGELWYRSDTDKFRARINSATENLATESYVTTAATNHVPFAAKTTTYTTTNADGTITADATSGSFTITLVTAVGNSGLVHTFKKITAANVVTIDGNGSQTIDGLTSYALSAQWSWLQITSDGANWLITGAG